MEGLLRLVVCEVAVGDGTMTVYRCDDSLADCAADLPLSDHGNDVDNDDEVASDGEDLLPQESTPSLDLRVTAKTCCLRSPLHLSNYSSLSVPGTRS